MQKLSTEEIIELYGLERILFENSTTIIKILDILDDLGYIDLNIYRIEEQEDYYDID